MLWTIAAPFFVTPEDRWIDDCLTGDDDRFYKIVRSTADSSWHDRAGRTTPLARWRSHWRQSARALRIGEGLITVFPQLAFTAAIQRGLRRGRQPIIAWCFNIGGYPRGLRGRIAARILRRIDHFVVHSRAEVTMLARWLGLAEDRISFVPLQRAPIPVLAGEEEDAPFAVAMGSANRDYPTLIEAARISGIPLTIVAAPRLFEGVSLPDNVMLLSNLPVEDCWRLAQRARFSIVPLADVQEASGQVTVVEALRMGRPLIATRSNGTADYVEHDRTGLFVPPADAHELATTMSRLWHDRALRERLGRAAATFADRTLSDASAAERLRALVCHVRSLAPPSRRMTRTDREHLDARVRSN